MRTKILTLAAALASLLPLRTEAQVQLTLTDVQTILSQSVSRALEVSPNALIAIVDNNGIVLAVWSVSGTTPNVVAVGAAVREAGTAAFLSSDQSALSSRTAQFIVQQHVPPGIGNRPPGPLVGVEFSQLWLTLDGVTAMISDVNRFKGKDAFPPYNGSVPASLGFGVPNTRLGARCSSAALYKFDNTLGHIVMVGGIGVYPVPSVSVNQEVADAFNVELKNQIAGGNHEESVAVTGAIGFQPSSNMTADNITNDGIRLPYVLAQPKQASNLIPFASLPGSAVVIPAGFPINPGGPASGLPVFDYTPMAAPPQPVLPQETFNGQTGSYYYPIISDPNPGLINGVPRLTANEVHTIVMNGALRASTTRGAIRLPVGVPMQCWVTVVANPNTNGAAPQVLAAFRTNNAPMFSFDVAVQKGRTALFFSSPQVAQSSRTVGFLAQDHYPPGIQGNPPTIYGPEQSLNGNISFNGLQIQFSFPTNTAPPFLGGFAPNGNLPNGITVFPGGFPLYRVRGDGVPVLIGAVGISGDGVDQDDIVGISATVGYQAPLGIRADAFTVGGARLPYAKIPRNPDIGAQ
jgi:uncharacterized protein GlcG (DUF336 family)